jgi:KaiC/GvpD/RAD55 family RecA-like ATPase
MSILEQILSETTQAHLQSDDPFKGLLTMEVTEEIIEKIADAKFAWRRLIPQGHMIVLVAEANGGKTTLMVHISAELAKDGYRVLYINADASASDIKQYKNHAMKHGYALINPDLTNSSADRVVNELRNIAMGENDFSKVVIVLDTLKKFGDMMNKSKSKEFNTLLRTLTAKGMTVICLAHTNKYSDKDGKPMYEGTGDTRNDYDELIYLIPVKNSDGTTTISTMADKVRAEIVDESFLITTDREIKVLDTHVDALLMKEFQRHLKEDEDVIQFILENIQTMSKSVTELRVISAEQKAGYSRERLKTVLNRYCSGNCKEPKWLISPASTNGYKYGKISPSYAKHLEKNWGG